jgi:hypothetical protein
MPDHYKPNKSWRVPGKSDLDILLNKNPDQSINECVQVFRLPEELITRLNAINIKNIVDETDLSDNVSRNAEAFASLNQSLNFLLIPL